MAFSYNAAINEVSFTYQAGDAIGDDVANPVKLVHVKDYANALGVTPPAEALEAEGQFYFPFKFRIHGVSTYFKIEEETLRVLDEENTGVGELVLMIYCNAQLDRYSLHSTQIMYIGASNVTVNSKGSLFTRFRTIRFTGDDTLMEDLVVSRIINTFYSYSANVTVNNIMCLEGTYGFIPQQDATITGVKIKDSTYAILVGYGSYTISNLETENCDYDFRIYHNGVNRECIFVDSRITLDSMILLGAGTSGENNYGSLILRNNFQVLCGQDGAVVRLYDNADTLVLDTVIAGGETTRTPITYYQRDTTFTSDVISILEPFRLEVSNAGFQTDVTEDIYMTEEVAGQRRGTLFPKVMDVTLELSSLEITAIAITDVTRVGLSDGQLEITAEGGDLTYEYSIDGTTYQASNTFTGLAAGSYTVYVKDGQTVPFTDSFAVEVQEPTLQPVPDDFDFELIDRDTISLELIDRDIIELELKDC